MSVCTFFGHRDCPGTIRPSLRKALVDLIQAHSVTFFYVGCQGGFDALVLGLLGELETEYPHIGYGVVTYITHPWGGAAQFAQKALRQNKQVINLAQ